MTEQLLSNAAKFTQNGHITLAAALNCDALEISVRDSGVGIAPEQIESLFETFVKRGDETQAITGRMPVSDSRSRIASAP